MQRLAEPHEKLASLALVKVTTVKATYAPNGTPLFVYSRIGSGAGGETAGETAAASVVDQDAVQAMLAARRDADRVAMMQADANSVGAAERGSLRTALMAAALM